jgi:glucuronate isomerase
VERSERLSFIHEDFLLHSDAARQLYHDYAFDTPILDYHSHLSASELAADHRFRDLTEIWLEGDHYKWRAMRANGIAEKYITGDASPYAKFEAWARTVPNTLRNPLYHWTHLELKRYFGTDQLLDPRSVKAIWERANSLLATEDFSANGILQKFNVKVVCTTDDPCDDLSSHVEINALDAGFKLYPTFRPDRVLQVDAAESFNAWISRLEGASNVEIGTLQDLFKALKRRHDYFQERGGRLSDHGLPHCFATPCNEREGERIFQKARAVQQVTSEEQEQFASLLMLFFGRLDAEKGWTKQLHLGALRRVNSRATELIGADSGFDCIGDLPQASALVSYLDLLDRENSLPRMILYNVNPTDNYAVATAAGSFHDGAVASKIQFGSGWWFLDQKEGIEWQLNALSNTGLLSRFVGMTTDSRSFMSFPRHEYFRRVLCNLLGREMEDGELPDDDRLVGAMVRRICFDNAREFLGLEVPHPAPQKQPLNA